MVDGGLSKQIELLVDNLRKQNTASMSLTEVASVTEVLIGTMNVFYKSIDTSIYRECRALSDYITNARKEIASLQPVDLESARIPRAGLELDAIVQQTEEATNTIMEAAEEIMGADPSDSDAYQATTQDAVMRIFEACSFQDITGQRISKVVETLSHIENRVLELRNLMGVTDEDVQEAMQADEPQGDKALLSGPALDGEGIDQSEVDNLMGGEAPAPAPEAAPTACASTSSCSRANTGPGTTSRPRPRSHRRRLAQKSLMRCSTRISIRWPNWKQKKLKRQKPRKKKGKRLKNSPRKRLICLPVKRLVRDDIDALFG